jgi:hypothetical protein
MKSQRCICSAFGVYHKSDAMNDALLVSDQQFGAGFFNSQPPDPGNRSVAGESHFYPEPSANAARAQGPAAWAPGIWSAQPAAGGRANMTGDARHAVEVLRAMSRQKHQAQRITQFQHERTWLAENRDRFLGRWVALEGHTLLAAGDTAREVFAKVSDRFTPPLVIRIDGDNRPFAGW